eukprot:Blabericola_migrator_1__7148@NODE_3620_length_1629_cov_17_325224_g197_i2_p1_GENE_NODE_3620_length_1629_cov_17_325224_g197_i2NODE_3620_length_1629_cov_17_325224_g197_i2_p1_ORF_typecomplete_len270_score40_69Ribosomal_L12_N/PF16320_5/0_24Ribosomal_L12_N/PF16320_5/1_6e04_NODE_3620_length_1629_cov_17_325224_g197_i26451454
MTCLRSVAYPKPSRLDAKSKIGVLTVVIPGLVSVAPNPLPPDTPDDIDAATLVEIFTELFKSLEQQLGTEDVLPHFQAAVGAAAEEVEALARETREPERVDILVRHLRSRFNGTGLAFQLKEALEAAGPKKRWFFMISGWALGGLKRALRLGTTSGLHQLLPLVSLLGMVGASPSVDEESLSPKTDPVASELTEEMLDDTGIAVKVGEVARLTLDVLCGALAILSLISNTWTPQLEYSLARIFPFGLCRLLMPPPPAPIPIRAKKSRRG